MVQDLSYPRILEERRKVHQAEYIQAFKQVHEEARTYDEKNLKKGEIFIEATLKVEWWEAYCDVLTKVEQDISSQKVTFEPTLTVGTYSITKEQKIELSFIGKLLGQIQKQLPTVGTIVGMDGKAHRVNLESGYKAITPFMKILQGWSKQKPTEPPNLILNKHCPSCQFRDLCRDQALKENNLSLLDRMTPKAVQKYNKKGIFTVLQLSYLFRPRRKRKKKERTAVITHSLELQALAIKEQKIYIQELPKLGRNTVEIFLDIEGIPDQNFYYLIGVFVVVLKRKGRTRS
jgi:predicted RecB family nuclease